jgi:hypothetical protein
MKMTTVKDIQEGNYCPNCDIDCVNWALDSDCCIVDTGIGRLYAQLNPESWSKEMKYEKKDHIIVYISGDNCGKTQKTFEEIKANCTVDKNDPEKKCLICDVKYCPLILRR